MPIVVKQLQGRGIEVPIIKNPDLESKPQGWEFFPRHNNNVLLLAKKQTGKTTCLFNILKKRLTKRHKLLVFSSTVNKDPTWEGVIIPWLNKAGIDFVSEQQFVGRDSNGVKFDLLRDLMKMLETKPEFPITMVIDDLSVDLRHPSVAALLKQSKHLNMDIYILTQYLNDLKPDSFSNLDYILLFGRQGREKIKEAHKKLEVSLPLPKFREIYELATKEPHSFLYLQRDPEKMRINFDKELDIPKEEYQEED